MYRPVLSILIGAGLLGPVAHADPARTQAAPATRIATIERTAPCDAVTMARVDENGVPLTGEFYPTEAATVVARTNVEGVLADAVSVEPATLAVEAGDPSQLAYATTLDIACEPATLMAPAKTIAPAAKAKPSTGK
ncbi:MAG: hypothetical protein ACREP7_06710 [Lysobacter sp.]